ncbi:hypothetical protein DO88_01425 [Pseudoalteromonas sp. S3431]|nr:hypothetical protein DO88_01425 [Pseudoalteromonas sp. S3431]
MRFYTSHCVLLKPRIKRDVKSHLRFVERGVCIVVGEVLYLAWCFIETKNKARCKIAPTLSLRVVFKLM